MTQEKLILEVGNSEKRLWIEDASAPQDVLWQNLGLSTKNKFYRRMISSLVTMIVIVVNFYLVFIIKFVGVRASEGRMEKIGGLLPFSY